MGREIVRISDNPSQWEENLCWLELQFGEKYYNPLNGTRVNGFKGLVDISVPGLPFAVVAQC